MSLSLQVHPVAYGPGPWWLEAPEGLWAPAAEPPGSFSEPMARYQLRVEQEALLPALLASSREEFDRLTEGALPEFARALSRLDAWRSMSASPAPAEDFGARLAERAASFGGDAWEDAALDGHADVLRALEIARDLLVDFPEDGEVLVAVGRLNLHVLRWSWSIHCFELLLRRQPRVKEEVLDAICQLMRESGREAYIAVRTLDLQRQQQAEAAAQGAEAVESSSLTPEEAELEEEAEAESRRLLASLKAE